MVVSKLHSLWLLLKFSPRVRQLLAGGGLSHGAIAIGTVIGWFPHALETLLVDPAFTPIPREKVGWMMLLVVIGALLALIPASYSAARFGRIWTTRFFCLALLGGWILVAAANSVDMILAGRFLLGISCGGFCIVIPLYMIEVADVAMRGMLGFMYTQQIYLGVVMALFTARHDPWPTLTIQLAPIAIVTFVFTIFVPETPAWHLRQGNLAMAQESLRWLRAPEAATDSAVVEEEISQLQDLLQHGAGVASSGSGGSTFSKKVIWTIVALLCIQPLLAISPVQFYSLWINLIGGHGPEAKMKPTSVALAVTGVSLLGMGIVGHFSERISRKKLLIASCSLTMVAFGVLGALYYSDPASERLYWPQFAGFCVLFFVYGVGFMALPHLLLVEVTNPRRVEAMLCVASACQWAIVLGLCFALVPLVMSPSSPFGVGPLFWISASLCVVAALLAYYNIPEVNGKSLSEIQGAVGAGSRPGSQQNMVDVTTMQRIDMDSIA